MDWYSSIFELIDMRSFSNLWYWIALAVVWSSASHWVLGVPYDMIQRARRVGGQAETDLLDIVRINTNRLLYIVEVSGTWLLAISCFLLSGLAMLGFYYGIEFAQAVFLLAFPMSIVGLLNLSLARKLRAADAELDPIAKLLLRCRVYTQLIGMVSIFVTSLWGMYQNLVIGPLG
ncbi:MAG: component of SufBCD complex [Ruegeria sp.]|uniref:component of SufBCD complex n=1 Tax=Ruegeria sp. TaxID=1879320 RepID=UPI00349EF8A0